LTEKQMDTFVCVHQRDVGYLLELVLRSYEMNFLPKGRLIMITNDLPHLQAFIDKLGLKTPVTLSGDRDWLSEEEMQLPGWYKQQLIKLRSYKFCNTENFCNLGADTVLLQPITESDLLDNGRPILYYTHHLLPDNHVRYERERVRYVGEMLKVEPTNAGRYVDFINDLFCFNRDWLTSLDSYLKQLYGDNAFVNMLKGLDDRIENRNKFGEWTLYSVYLLDKLHENVTLRSTGNGYLHQVHSNLSLRTFRFNTKVAHFVSKNLDVDYIKRQISKRNLELAATF
jgi:hypothetical protein